MLNYDNLDELEMLKEACGVKKVWGREVFWLLTEDCLKREGEEGKKEELNIV